LTLIFVLCVVRQNHPTVGLWKYTLRSWPPHTSK
jgi:hypothetical protein